MRQKLFICFNTWDTNLGRFLYLHLIKQRHYYRMSMWQIDMEVMMCELLLMW